MRVEYYCPKGFVHMSNMDRHSFLVDGKLLTYSRKSKLPALKKYTSVSLKKTNVG